MATVDDGLDRHPSRRHRQTLDRRSTDPPESASSSKRRKIVPSLHRKSHCRGFDGMTFYRPLYLDRPRIIGATLGGDLQGEDSIAPVDARRDLRQCLILRIGRYAFDSAENGRWSDQLRGILPREVEASVPPPQTISKRYRDAKTLILCKTPLSCTGMIKDSVFAQGIEGFSFPSHESARRDRCESRAASICL